MEVAIIFVETPFWFYNLNIHFLNFTKFTLSIRIVCNEPFNSVLLKKNKFITEELFIKSRNFNKTKLINIYLRYDYSNYKHSRVTLNLILI